MTGNAQADNCSAWPSNPIHQEDGGGGVSGALNPDPWAKAW